MHLVLTWMGNGLAGAHDYGLLPLVIVAFLQGRSEGGGVQRCPLCKPFLRKQPTIFCGENAMMIMFDTV